MNEKERLNRLETELARLENHGDLNAPWLPRGGFHAWPPQPIPADATAGQITLYCQLIQMVLSTIGPRALTIPEATLATWPDGLAQLCRERAEEVAQAIEAQPEKWPENFKEDVRQYRSREAACQS